MANNIKKLPIMGYVIVYSLIGFVAAASVMTYMYYGATAAQSKFKETITISAKEDLHRGFDASEKQAREVAVRIANWNEAQQQLSKPAYYGYWKDNRLTSRYNLPNYIVNIDLFDVDGNNLETKIRNNGVINNIKHINGGKPANVIVKTKDGLFCTDFVAITTNNPAGETIVVGYVGVTVNLNTVISQHTNLRYIHPSSLDFNVSQIGVTELSEENLIQQMTFDVKVPKEVAHFTGLVDDAVIQLVILVAIGGALFVWMMFCQLSRPLRRMKECIANFKQDQENIIPDDFMGRFKISELQTVADEINENQREIQSMKQDLTVKNESLVELTRNDALTGILNRRAFDEDWYTLSDSDAKNAAILLIDCDNFKPINDQYGHQVGDDVLKTIASLLSRTISMRRQDHVYRLGGDEFTIVLRDVNEAEIQMIAERCHEEIKKYDFTKYGIKEPVRISLGYSRSNCLEVEQLISMYHQADIAMYHAKTPTNKKIVGYVPELESSNSLMSNRSNAAVVGLLTDSTDVRIEMHYQPIYDTKTQTISYYESLMRVFDAGGLISPGEIFPVVEAKRLDTDIDKIIINSIYDDIEAGLIPAGTGLSINISAPSLLDQRVIDRLMDFIKFLDDYKIVIEVTETSLVKHMEKATLHLQILRGAGFKIALDDFGSGYSSFLYLANLPVDIIKFDKKIVDELTAGREQYTIVIGLINMITDAGYDIVAEGCECGACAEEIIANGIPYVQGFYYGKPQRPPQDNKKFPEIKISDKYCCTEQ